MREPSSQTGTPATMTPMVAMTSFAEKVQDAHMWMPRAVPGDERAAGQVRRERDEPDTDDEEAHRLAADQEPARDVDRDQQAKRDLQDPAHCGGLRLQAPRASDGTESPRVHEGVREHVERVGREAGRLAEPLGHCLDYVHCGTLLLADVPAAP